MSLKRVKFSAVLLLGLILGIVTMPAKADIGYVIGIIANDSTFDTSGSEEEGRAGSEVGKTEVTSASVSEDADFTSFFAEVVAKGDNVGIAIGFEYVPGEASLGSKTRTDTDVDENTTGTSYTYTAKAEVSDHMTLYVEPIIYPVDFLGVYGKMGISQVTVNTLEAIASGIDSSAYGDETVFGATFGAGLRVNTPIGLVIKAEYAKTQYEGVRFVSTTGNNNIIKASPEQESTRLMLGWQF